MKTTLLLLTLGYLGYRLYDHYNRTGSLVGAFGGNVSNLGSSNNFSSEQSIPNTNLEENYRSGSNPVFDPGIEAQMTRGEGMTNEAKVGIND